MPQTPPLPGAEAYDLLLDRAGATGLSPADRALLYPVLPMIDAKIALIRARAAEAGKEAGEIDPTTPTGGAAR